MLPLVVQAMPVRLKVAMPAIQSTDGLSITGQTDVNNHRSMRSTAVVVLRF
ncbi:MAG: hypothetical protein VB030_01505 [Eubacterium aggregans]|nr:hypothetical protein [Eubacterium aggregans]